MKTNTENRKALPKFILTLVAALLVGCIAGTAIALSDGDWTKQVGPALTAFLETAAPYLLAAAAAISLVSLLVLYSKAKKLADRADTEDDALPEQADLLLTIALMINTACGIASYFLFAVPMILAKAVSTGYSMTCVGLFLLNIAILIVGQQKIVDLTKKLNPEKHGSVYDVHFAKTWYESCDEMERAIIGQAAYTAYKVTTRTCLALWLLLVLGGMLFDIGLLPVAVVSVIWLVSALSYSIRCMQLERSGGK